MNAKEGYLCLDCQIDLFERLYEHETDEEKKRKLRKLIDEAREKDTWTE